MRRLHALLVGTALVGCAPDEPALEPIPEPVPAPSTIDQAVQRLLEDAGLEPVLAGDTELCRRLFADLIGRFPSADEVATDCAGRAPEQVALELQQREEYVVRGQRHWRDQLGSSDSLLYWRDLAPAFDLVAQLQSQAIGYDEFVIAMTAEPGLMVLDPDPAGRAYRVHRVFLGGEATEAMASDLARLTRIWDVRPFDIPAFGNIVQDAPRAYIVPGNCGELGVCRTELVPNGSIEFPDPGSRPFNGIKYELLSDEQRRSLMGLGEHLVTMPQLWDAAADEILDRLLGWSDGGAEPRRPGRLLPEVRALVAEHLFETKSIASAERMVMASLLYRQTNRAVEQDVEGDQEPLPRPIWAHGPLKRTRAEVLLDTLRGTSTAEGSCDPRLADDRIYRQHLVGLFSLAVDDPEGTVADYDEFIVEFHGEQGNWRPLLEQELVNPENSDQVLTTLALDPAYLELARTFGGCPGINSPRLSALDGLAYAFGQEIAANELCESEAVRSLVPADSSLDAMVGTFTSRLFGRPPTPEELAAFDSMACTSCDSEALEQGVCVALLGSHELLFY